MSSYGEVGSENQCDFAENGKEREGGVEFFVFDFDRGGATGDVEDRADRVADAESVEVIPAFDEGIGKVKNEDDGKEAEDPLAARVEVLLEALIVGHFLWEKEHAEEKEQDRVHSNEEIEREGPLLDISSGQQRWS